MLGDGPIVYDNICMYDRLFRSWDAQIEEQRRQEGMSQWSRKLEVRWRDKARERKKERERQNKRDR